MSPRHRCEKLLQHPQIWRAGRAPATRHDTLPTGFAGLDHALAGGWPVGALIELLIDSCGKGEFRLLVPALQTLSRVGNAQAHWVMLIAPPYIPYAPALLRQGIDIARLQVVRCERRSDVFWATEQALDSGSCAAVLAWSSAADERGLRRLQLAAERGHSWLVLFRPSRFRRRPSPATLRIECRTSGSAGQGLSVDVFKNRGARPCVVHLPG